VYEHSNQPLLPRPIFLRRVFRSFAVAAVIVGVWLVIGILGYHWLAKLGWVDSILNSSMILSGMGPVDPLPSDGAKLFASAYAILSGVVFLSTSAILVAPVVHRLMHHFHLQSKAES
jgi:hypothetical protein